MNKYNIEKNFTLLADFYELTMANGYFKEGMGEKTVYFEMFFRDVPDNGTYAIIAGLEQLIEYFEDLHFSEDDIEFLRGKGIFSEDFLDYLRDFKFECDVWAMPEGTIAFPQEPLVVVKGPAIQAQMLETMVLLTINHQSMIATKANRIVKAANGRPVSEFGSRRAQGYSGANLGARAAYIGGVIGTANTLADKMFGVPAVGTMAHSWVQMFDTELDAFKAFARVYPDSCYLLVDTYDTLKSGVPNAIKTFDEEVVPKGFRPKGIRIDSGDIAYLSKKARKMLDDAGYKDVTIMASNSLDEFTIKNILNQGARVDSFGVGERLITSKSSPVFGGVYKLTAIESEDGKIIPKIKISENVTKITTPGFKDVYRFYDKDSNKAIADVVGLKDEEIPEGSYEIFHPIYTWKRKTLKNYYTKKLLVQIYDKGRLVYDLPSLDQVRDKAKEELSLLWDEITRIDNPTEYIVDLSEDLWTIRDNLLKKYGKNQ